MSYKSPFTDFESKIRLIKEKKNSSKHLVNQDSFITTPGRKAQEEIKELIRKDVKSHLPALQISKSRDVSHLRDLNSPKFATSFLTLPTEIEELKSVVESRSIIQSQSKKGLCKKKKCRQMAVCKSPPPRPEIVEYLDNIDSGMPTGRKDIQNLIEWFKIMKENYENTEEFDTVIVACEQELVRQVNVQCKNRGFLLRTILKYYKNALTKKGKKYDQDVLELEKAFEGKISILTRKCSKNTEKYQQEKMKLRNMIEEYSKSEICLKKDLETYKKRNYDMQRFYIAEQEAWKRRISNLLQERSNRNLVFSNETYKLAILRWRKDLFAANEEHPTDLEIPEEILRKIENEEQLTMEELALYREAYYKDINERTQNQYCEIFTQTEEYNYNILPLLGFSEVEAQTEFFTDGVLEKETQTEIDLEIDKETINNLELLFGISEADEVKMYLDEINEVDSIMDSENSSETSFVSGNSQCERIEESENDPRTNSEILLIHNESNSRSHSQLDFENEVSLIGQGLNESLPSPVEPSHKNSKLLKKNLKKNEEEVKRRESEKKINKNPKNTEMKRKESGTKKKKSEEKNRRESEKTSFNKTETREHSNSPLSSNAEELSSPHPNKKKYILNIKSEDQILLSKNTSDFKTKRDSFLSISPNAQRRSSESISSRRESKLLKGILQGKLGPNLQNITEIILKRIMAKKKELEKLDDLIEIKKNQVEIYRLEKSDSIYKRRSSAVVSSASNSLTPVTMKQLAARSSLRPSDMSFFNINLLGANLKNSEISSDDEGKIDLNPPLGMDIASWKLVYETGFKHGKKKGFGRGIELGKENGYSEGYFQARQEINTQSFLSEKIGKKTDSKLASKNMKKITKFSEFNLNKQKIVVKKDSTGLVDSITDLMKKLPIVLKKGSKFSRKMVFKLISGFYSSAYDQMLNEGVSDFLLICYEDIVQKYVLKKVSDRKFLDLIVSVIKNKVFKRCSIFLQLISLGDLVSLPNYSTLTFLLYVDSYHFIMNSKIGIVMDLDETDDKLFFPLNRALECAKEKLEGKSDKPSISQVLSLLDQKSLPDPLKINTAVIELEIALEIICTHYENTQIYIRKVIENIFIRIGFNGTDTVPEHFFHMVMRTIGSNKYSKIEELGIKESLSFDEISDLCINLNAFSQSDLKNIANLYVGTIVQYEDLLSKLAESDLNLKIPLKKWEELLADSADSNDDISLVLRGVYDLEIKRLLVSI